MAVYIELVTSPALRKSSSTAANVVNSSGSRAGKSRARRPFRGIEIKDDTYASLKVLLPNGTELPLIDSSEKASGSNTQGLSKNGTTNFILQSVQEQRAERTQTIQTFGASYVFFFGEEPRMLQCSAVLVNTLDFNWEAEWWANYNCYLRGTKLVEMGARCFLSYDDTVVEGYMMNASSVKSADSPYMVQLQFTFFVVGCYNVSSIGETKYPIHGGVTFPVDLRSEDATKLLWEGAPMYAAYKKSAAAAEKRAKAADKAKQSFGNFLEYIKDNVSKSFTEKREAKKLIEAQPASFGWAPGVYNALVNANESGTWTEATNYDNTFGYGSLRGYIHENEDEYTQRVDTSPDLADEALGDVPVTYLQHPSIETCGTMGAAFFGAGATGFQLSSGLGLLPNYIPGSNQATFNVIPQSGGYASAGIGTSAVAGAGFNYGSNIGGGFVGTMGPQTGYVAGASYVAGIGPDGPYAQSASYAGMSQSPGLSAVYGQPMVAGGNGNYYTDMARWNPLAGNSNTYNQPNPNNTYVAGANYNLLTGESETFAGKLADAPPSFGFGYPSPYAMGPGYAQPGYGNFGGFPYGAGVRADPAFMNPNNVGIREIAQTSSGTLTINNQAPGTWNNGVYPGYGPSGQYFGASGISGSPIGASALASGGASIGVGGQITAFATMVSPGTLAPQGNASTYANAVSNTGVFVGGGTFTGASAVASIGGTSLGIGASVGVGMGANGGCSPPGGFGLQLGVGASVGAVAGTRLF
jgi:hypothetical protein